MPTKKPASCNFPAGLSAPALRALHNAGIRTMAELAKWSEKDLAKLHGLGPSGLRLLASARAGVRQSSPRKGTAK